MTSTQTIKNRINKALSRIGTYHESIPLDAIFQIVNQYAGVVVQEDGSPWSGWLTGEHGNCRMAIENSKIALYVSWYRMPSGRYEITSYVS